MPDYPTIPTFAELGYGDVASTVWFSLAGPAGLPPDIVQKVNREVVRVMTAPQNQDRLSKLGVVADGMSPEQLDALVATEMTRWKPVLEQLGLVEK
jgi:tripartite-type tricarboxylate transporter receptor subunit TctC